MATLLYKGLLKPCHTSISYQARPVPLYTFDKNNAPFVNHKKPFFTTSIKSMVINDDDHHHHPDSYSNDLHRRNHSESMFLQQASTASTAPILSNFQSRVRFIKGILAMSRLEDYLPSMALVLGGGWIGSERSMEAVMRPGQVWIVAGCSGLITVASMLVNDLFDFCSGTDQANGRTSPLLSGQIHPFHVGLVVSCLYGACVIGVCYLEPMSLRLLIVVAAIATYIYTPLLKHITMVKNVVVSSIVSSSIFAGALAIGSKEPLRNRVGVVSLFLFLCIMGREILMDVRDMVGDKATGVNTLAVLFGGQIGILIATLCFVVANALLIILLAVKAQEFAIIGTMILVPLYAKMLLLCKDLGATEECLIRNSIQPVVQQAVVHIGFGSIVLASVI